jgi:hypothetical protein
MRRHGALATAILVSVLVVAATTPAHAAPRLRQYKGQKSQVHNQ